MLQVYVQNLLLQSRYFLILWISATRHCLKVKNKNITDIEESLTTETWLGSNHLSTLLWKLTFVSINFHLTFPYHPPIIPQIDPSFSTKCHCYDLLFLIWSGGGDWLSWMKICALAIWKCNWITCTGICRRFYCCTSRQTMSVLYKETATIITDWERRQKLNSVERSYFWDIVWMFSSVCPRTWRSLL